MQEEVTRKAAGGTNVPSWPCRGPAAIPTPAGVPPGPSSPASPTAWWGPPDPGAPSPCRPPSEAGSGAPGGHCAPGPPGGRGPASPTGACTQGTRPDSGRVPAGLQGPCERTYCPATCPSLTLQLHRGGAPAPSPWLWSPDPPVPTPFVLMRMPPRWGPIQAYARLLPCDGEGPAPALAAP